MLRRRTLLGAGLIAPALGAACATAPRAADPLTPLPHDPDSYARPNEARVRHISLDLTADFERQIMAGACTLSVAAAPGAREIVLDALNLNIASVTTNQGAAEWRLGEHQDRHGAPLHIALAPGVETITIAYESAPGASSLQWLEPAQTASGKKFLFSQGQAILNRSWIPMQDTPGVRITYDARIVAPEGLIAVMSADMLTPAGEPAGPGQRAFRFAMPEPIPAYLIALAIGELEHRAVSENTGVWAEPSVVDRAAREFDDMGHMMQVAEAIYGPYRWGRYDVLVLPPAFPFGGMENPRLTFATPTLLAGDKSLNNVIAHELAHSWSGNLVTNAVWADGWLNEGFTSYIEERICEVLYGEDYVLMGRALAWADIQAAIAAGRTTTLYTPSGSSAVAYTKGAQFLHTLEAILGRARMDRYMRSYFDRHAFGPMTTAGFLADFREHEVRGDAALEARMLLDEWAYQNGLPANAEEPRPQGFAEVERLAAEFAAGGAPAGALWANWVTFQRQRYLKTLPRQLPRARLDALEAALGLNETGNSEVLFDWLSLAIANGYAPAAPAITRFLTGMGRGKFVTPLFRALMAQGAWGQGLARAIYAQARAGYHPVVQRNVDTIVTPA